VIDFHIERTGVPPYLQLVAQVKQALRLGWLAPGDKLPTVHEVAAAAVVNSNTVLKAYKELEREGLVTARQGVGTFVSGSLSGAPPAAYEPLRRDLARWLTKARRAGLDDEGIEALFASTFRATAEQDIA